MDEIDNLFGGPTNKPEDLSKFFKGKNDLKEGSGAVNLNELFPGPGDNEANPLKLLNKLNLKEGFEDDFEEYSNEDYEYDEDDDEDYNIDDEKSIQSVEKKINKSSFNKGTDDFEVFIIKEYLKFKKIHKDESERDFLFGQEFMESVISALENLDMIDLYDFKSGILEGIN